ncbi:MAG: DUF1801 domain-containing protein [Thermoplasmata archaeon]|nr:DUF1801 domain-containing protein [Thermoplasmata archaeon]
MATAPPKDPKVDVLLEGARGEVRPIAVALRRLVRTHAPELREATKWGNPVWIGRRVAVCLMVYDRHVNLGLFQGAALAARFPEIEGTGKNLRHVKVPDLASARRPVLARILRAAVALDAASG